MLAVLLMANSASALEHKRVPLSRSGSSKGAAAHKMIPADTAADEQDAEREEMRARPNLDKISDQKEKKSTKTVTISRSGGSASARKIKVTE